MPNFVDAAGKRQPRIIRGYRQAIQRIEKRIDADVQQGRSLQARKDPSDLNEPGQVRVPFLIRTGSIQKKLKQRFLPLG
ncbi:hypothetical protein D3C76_1097010 [compost metagenome]